MMELKIKAKINNFKELERVIKIIKEIEKEHSCNCTLLEVDSTHQEGKVKCNILNKGGMKMEDKTLSGKLEWLKSIGAIDISSYNYLTPSNGHLYSLEYLNNRSLQEVKEEYKSLYSKRSNDNILSNFGNKRNG